ncbi:MAG: site-specific integrase [Candidatus Thiodiazotropha lotti]|nr:site-specific integrase [Candidatus Thiodiazotropha lotti]MCW4216653.1 site-specific integrase [Candidatus Thiodiazotropha lotti]
MANKHKVVEVRLARGVRGRNSAVQIEFTYKRIRCKETLRGLSPVKKKDIQTAINKRASVLLSIQLGTFNYAEEFPDSPKAEIFGHILTSNLTVFDVVDMYLRQIANSKDADTIKDYRGHLNNHIGPGIGHILADNLRLSQIHSWLGDISLSNKSKNNWLSILRPALQAAKNEELITRNPLDGVPNLPIDKKPPDPFTIEEIDSILNAFTLEEAHMFYQVGFWTGLSPSERLGLKWENVDLEQHCVYIIEAIVSNKEKGPKNNFRKRKVTLLPPAEKAIRILKKTSGSSPFVFNDVDTRTRWKEEKIRGYWKPTLTKAKVRYRPGKNTRHTYASTLLSLGVPLGWVKEQMGHGNYRMLEERYARWINISPKQRQRVLKWFQGMASREHLPDEIRPFIKLISE